MIDIEAIEEWNSHDLGGDAYEVQAIVSKGDLMDIITALRQSEKDAARYRWLRDEARHHMDGGPLVFMTNYDGDPVAYQDCGMVLHESYLNEAIDEAMSVNQA